VEGGGDRRWGGGVGLRRGEGWECSGGGGGGGGERGGEVRGVR